MERRTRALLVGLIAVGGAVVLVALTVAPFQYGLVESLLLVGILVALAVAETVLGDTSF